MGNRAGSLHTSPGYRFIRIDKIRYREHRLAFYYMTGKCPEQIDHIDHNRSNNKWANLRPSDYKLNGKNQPKTTRNKTGVVGVSLTAQGKFRARIYTEGVSYELGIFTSLDEARIAREKALVRFDFHPNHGK